MISRLAIQLFNSLPQEPRCFGSGLNTLWPISTRGRITFHRARRKRVRINLSAASVSRSLIGILKGWNDALDSTFRNSTTAQPAT